MDRRVTPALAGIFVGGAGKRMGGVAKGLMLTPDGTTVIDRTRAILARMGLGVVLVGQRKEYEGLGLEVVEDQPCGIGPLGGLLGLLGRAGDAPVLAIACDMPFVSEALVARLLAEWPEAPIVAPRRDGRWEPLCARYDPTRVTVPALTLGRVGAHSLQRLLDDAGAVELSLEKHEAEELRDWDTPQDVV